METWDPLGAHDRWVTVIGHAASRLAAVRFGVAVVDPRTGAVVYANPAMARWLGGSVPPTVAAAAALDVVPAATRHVLSALVTDLGDEDSCHNLDVRVTPPDGPAREVHLHVLHVHAVAGDGEALVVTAVDDAHDWHPQHLELQSDALWAVKVAYDLDLVIVGADRRFREWAMDPADQVGGHLFVMLHPEDVPAVSALARGLVAGRFVDVEFDARAVGPHGRWAAVRVALRRLEGPRPLVVADVRPTDLRFPPIDPGTVTDREMEIARALFVGRRAPQIAERLGVSAKTVRNHMSSLYRKLGVSTQSELVASYSMPPRPWPRDPSRVIDGADAAAPTADTPITPIGPDLDYDGEVPADLVELAARRRRGEG